MRKNQPDSAAGFRCRSIATAWRCPSSALAFAIFQPIQVLPRISLAPGFSFTDQHGARLTSDDLRGKLVYYTFMHTGWRRQQAQTVQGLKVIQQAVDEAGSSVPVEFVAISFDPQRDTAERLRHFATEQGLDGEHWHPSPAIRSN